MNFIKCTNLTTGKEKRLAESIVKNKIMMAKIGMIVSDPDYDRNGNRINFPEPVILKSPILGLDYKLQPQFKVTNPNETEPKQNAGDSNINNSIKPNHNGSSDSYDNETFPKVTEKKEPAPPRVRTKKTKKIKVAEKRKADKTEIKP